MVDLVTLNELRIWTRRDIPDADPFALAVISAASLKVLDECGNPPTWTTISNTPAMVKTVAVQLAKRTYQYPDPIVGEGGIGPIGGDRFVEAFVRTLELTPAELDTLHNIDGTIARQKASEGLWVLEINRPEPDDTILYLADSDGSNWMIPFLDVDLDPYYKPLPSA